MTLAIFSLLMIIIMLVLLAKDIYEPVIIFFAGLAIFVIVGVIDLNQALEGLTNQGMLTIAALFMITGTMEKSREVHKFVHTLFGEDKSKGRSQLKVMVPIAGLSAFMNNIPLVALFMPLVRSWAIENKVSPSKYLIPLSYAAIFGGLLTLVGTSTNLVVNGLMEQHGLRGLSMFEIGAIGLPLAIAGILYFVLIGHRLLPDNEDLLESFKTKQRDYLVCFIVSPGCKLIGKSVSKAGLRNLQGLFLVEIIRDGKVITPVTPDEEIDLKDKLIFSGDISTIGQLQDIQGLRLETSSDEYEDYLEKENAHIVEAVISETFPYLGETIKNSNFRSRYDSSVVAVLRNGERIKEKIGKIKLRSGDTILLLAGQSFLNTWGSSKDFYLTNKVGDYQPSQNGKGNLALILFMIMIILSALSILPLLKGAFLALVILFLTRTITLTEAKRLIKWNTLLMIILALGIGDALSASGATSLVADGLVSLMRSFGPTGIVLAVYLLTNILTEIITNNAAAALAFPIGLTAALQAGIDPRPIAITIAVAASASFATPIGYQTNLMVYGPGGYKFKDFLKVGLPLNIIFLVLSVILIPIIWPM